MFNLQVRKIIIIIFYKVFKNYLIYIRNNVQHIYYFVSKKQKKLLRYLKRIYYIFYKFKKKTIFLRLIDQYSNNFKTV